MVLKSKFGAKTQSKQLMFMGDSNGTNVVQDVRYPPMDDILTSSTFRHFPMVTKTPFKEVTARLDALTEKLKSTTDEDERRRLLKEFRALLGKADATTSEC